MSSLMGASTPFSGRSHFKHRRSSAPKVPRRPGFRATRSVHATGAIDSLASKVPACRTQWGLDDRSDAVESDDRIRPASVFVIAGHYRPFHLEHGRVLPTGAFADALTAVGGASTGGLCQSCTRLITRTRNLQPPDAGAMRAHHLGVGGTGAHDVHHARVRIRLTFFVFRT